MPSFFFTKHHNYWPIYSTIQQYYPLGIISPSHDLDFAQQYPGQILLWDIVSERISDYPDYRRRWKPFQEHLKAQVKKPVHQLEGLNPSYTGYIPFKKRKEKDWEYRKELHFAISLLGPYYTIYGLDTSLVELPETRHAMGHPEPDTSPISRQGICAVTVSPYEEYAALFTVLETAIQAWFPEHRLVPFKIGTTTLSGLEVEGYSFQPACVHAALFHANIP